MDPPSTGYYHGVEHKFTGFWKPLHALMKYLPVHVADRMFKHQLWVVFRVRIHPLHLLQRNMIELTQTYYKAQ